MKCFEILDEVALQNSHNPFNDFLISVFLEREDTLKFLQNFANHAMLNTKLERDLNTKGNHHGKLFLKECRMRIIAHFEVEQEFSS